MGSSSEMLQFCQEILPGGQSKARPCELGLGDSLPLLPSLVSIYYIYPAAGLERG